MYVQAHTEYIQMKDNQWPMYVATKLKNHA